MSIEPLSLGKDREKDLRFVCLSTKLSLQNDSHLCIFNSFTKVPQFILVCNDMHVPHVSLPVPRTVQLFLHCLVPILDVYAYGAQWGDVYFWMAQYDAMATLQRFYSTDGTSEKSSGGNFVVMPYSRIHSENKNASSPRRFGDLKIAKGDRFFDLPSMALGSSA